MIENSTMGVAACDFQHRRLSGYATPGMVWLGFCPSGKRCFSGRRCPGRVSVLHCVNLWWRSELWLIHDISGAGSDFRFIPNGDRIAKPR